MVKIPKKAVEAAAKAIADSIGHGMSEKCFDHARAGLTAAAPHMSGVKVKQLEWREKDNDAYAHSDVGYYEINETRLGFCVYRNMFIVSKDMFETLEAAKAAAQADYEKRFWAMADIGADDTAIERVARAWSSIDGKSLEFDRAKKDPEFDRNDGSYSGYMTEAKELIKRSGILDAEPSSAREKGLPSELMRKHVDDYEWITDGSDYTPDNTERAMIEYAIAGYAGYVDEVLSSSSREQTLEEGYRRGVKNAAKKAAELLVFTDTTSKAIKEIIAAIRALSSQDHDDAGKVEGDGWRPINVSTPRDQVILAWGNNWYWERIEKAYLHSDYKGHKNVICWGGFAGAPFSLGRPDAPTHWRPIPPAPQTGVGE